MNIRKTLYVGAAMSALAFAGAAQAQTASPSTSPEPDQSATVEDIVVTAQRRDERLQDVPIAVSAVTGSQAAQRGVVDTASLTAAVPALTVTKQGNSGTMFLRGVGSNAGNVNDEPSVALYVDGVYIAAPNTNLFNFTNIDRIEVLKGPQGTLFGRNATGGVIQIVTKDPSKDPSADLGVGYANFDTISGSLYATTGLSENLAIDISVTGSDQRDGWGRNVTRNEDTYLEQYVAVRSKALWTPGDATEVRFSLDYLKSELFAYDYRATENNAGVDGNANFVGYYNSRADGVNSSVVEQGGASLRIDHDFGGFRIANIASYRESTGLYRLDQDATPVPLVQADLSQSAHNYTEELQILSAADSKVNWLVGVFYFNSTAAYDPGRIGGLVSAPLPYFDINNETNVESYSLYGQATYEFITDTRFTAGLRYTDEKQKVDGVVDSPAGPISPFVSQNQGFDAYTWRLSLDHNFAPDILGYVSYNRGIKSGNFNLLGVGQPGYRPEQIDAYEIGLKNQLFGNRVRLNVAAFYYDYSDIQVQIASAGGTSIVNAASATVKGVDFDLMIAAGNGLTIFAGGAYVDSTYGSYPGALSYPANPGPATPDLNIEGKSTLQAPEFTGNLGFNKSFSTAIGEINAGANLTYNSGFVFASDNRLDQDAFTVINASAVWTSPSESFDVRLWAKNLGDEKYQQSGFEQAGLGDLVLPAAPRTYGVTLTAHF